MTSMATQLGQAARALARSTTFTLVTVLTLGVGVGAVTAIFTVLDRVALRPLPYPEANRLVRIEAVVPRQDPSEIWGLSEAGYFLLDSEASTLEGIGGLDDALEQVRLTFSGSEGTFSVPGDSVTAGVLSLLGARPALGRLLAPSDERRGAPPVVLLSHELWQSYFGADSAVVGRTVRVGGAAREVIGVTVPGFGMPDGRARAWVPLALDPLRPAENDHWLGAMGRLAPGVTLAEAQAELDELTSQLPVRFPDAYEPDFMEDFGFAMRVVPLRAKVIGTVGRTLWTLLVGVGLLLLIALANVASLFLVRTEGRRGELAVRTALGARRLRLAGESMAEGVLVGGLAGLVGLLLAMLALDALLALSPTALPRLAEVRLGRSGIGIAFATALIAAAAAGALPLLWVRPELGGLCSGGRGSTPSRGWRLFRCGLVGFQVALAVVLLAGMGLTVRSLDHLLDADPGFTAEGVLTFQVFLPASPYGDFQDGAAFYRELSQRLEALPPVARAGAIESLPYQPYDGCWITYPVGSELPPNAPTCVPVLAATPGYLEAMGIPVEGRIPDWGDMEAGTGAVVVTGSLADRYWPGEVPSARPCGASAGATLRRTAWSAWLTTCTPTAWIAFLRPPSMSRSGRSSALTCAGGRTGAFTGSCSSW